jgi:hypothetical protein
MSRKEESWLHWTLAAVGFVGTGFAVGLHRLVWGLFFAVAVLWCGFFWTVAVKHHGEPFYWLVAFGPPIVVGIVVRLIEKIVFAFFGGLANVPASGQSSPEEKKRQRLGY